MLAILPARHAAYRTIVSKYQTHQHCARFAYVSASAARHMSDNHNHTSPRVAIVGGGIAGATCSHMLTKLGAHVTVFDMGKQQAGGRLSTRPANKPGGFQFDYGCQFFTASSHTMKALTQKWLAAGVVAEWRPKVAVYDKARGSFALREKVAEGVEEAAGPTSGSFFGRLLPVDSGESLFVGRPGMGALVAHLLNGAPGVVREPNDGEGSGVEGVTTVQLGTKVRRARFAESRWWLGGETASDATEASPHEWNLGCFDALVLADSQVARKGSPGYITFPDPAPTRLGELLPRLAALPRAPLFALILGWDDAAAGGPLLPAATALGGPVAADVMLVVGGRAVEWIAKDNSKPGRERSDGMTCWVVLTTSTFAEELLAADRREGSGEGGADGGRTGGGSPSLPPATAEYRTRKAEQIWAAVQEDLCGLAGSIAQQRPVYLSAHRWGSAYPTASLGDSGKGPAVWEEGERWAACGDYCSGGHPGVETAVASGVAAAEAVGGMLGLAGGVGSKGLGLAKM